MDYARQAKAKAEAAAKQAADKASEMGLPTDEAKAAAALGFTRARDADRGLPRRGKRASRGCRPATM